MNEHDCVPIKLYLQKREVGQTWPVGCGVLISVSVLFLPTPPVSLPDHEHSVIFDLSRIDKFPKPQLIFALREALNSHS